MRILIVEPFFSGSHAAWAKGFQQYSRHQVEILSLPGRHWKWRMHGGAVALADKYKRSGMRPDLILATDMLDLAVFLGLCGSSAAGIPSAVYFHENQLSYPWSPDDRDVDRGRDFHYGFINWTTALAADQVFFNSTYNKESFYAGLRTMLKAMPDARGLNLVDKVESKSEVLPLGMDLNSFRIEVSKKEYALPVLLWNHRWEYDKDPELFFRLARTLKAEGVDFRLIVCGESYGIYPPVFNMVRSEFEDELLHFGYAKNRKAYQDLLAQANILPVTSKQEFFGQSVMEAVAAGCLPILPDALAYTDHVPESLRSSLLYRTGPELIEKVSNACRDLTKLKPFIEAMQGIAEGYDWSVQKDRYDDIFDQMI